MSEPTDQGGRERAHEEFLHPGPLPEGADLAGAEARLLDALERELGVRLATPAPAPPAAARRAAPRWRAGLALAAALAVVAGLWWQLGPERARRASTLRGARGAAAHGPWDATPRAVPAGAGGMRLTWSPAPGATRYAVVFLGADLTELARVDSLARPGLTLAHAALPAGLTPGRAVLWRVSAYAGGDEIGRSATSPLALP